jgi:hypothetical protein
LENSYWLGRTRTALDSAERAISSEARLFHLELAGRYTAMALAVANQKRRQTNIAPKRALNENVCRPARHP